MITETIVWASVGASLVFVLAWALRPDLRIRMERPKHDFLRAVQRYDREQSPMDESKGSRSS
jgi:hypothetical protein